MREEKKEAKRKLRLLRKTDATPESIKKLARVFSLLLRRYSKLVKEEDQRDLKRNTAKERKECHKNFWKYTKRLLNEENYTSIEPKFTKEEATTYLQTTYSTNATTYTRPSWKKPAAAPTTPCNMDAITPEELAFTINKCKSLSIPSPTDQISYHILKKCPSLRPALLQLYNHCWATRTTPKQWKVGVIHLLGKKSAESHSANQLQTNRPDLLHRESVLLNTQKSLVTLYDFEQVPKHQCTESLCGWYFRLYRAPFQVTLHN